MVWDFTPLLAALILHGVQCIELGVSIIHCRSEPNSITASGCAQPHCKALGGSLHVRILHFSITLNLCFIHTLKMIIGDQFWRSIGAVPGGAWKIMGRRVASAVGLGRRLLWTRWVVCAKVSCAQGGVDSGWKEQANNRSLYTEIELAVDSMRNSHDGGIWGCECTSVEKHAHSSADSIMHARASDPAVVRMDSADCCHRAKPWYLYTYCTFTAGELHSVRRPAALQQPWRRPFGILFPTFSLPVWYCRAGQGQTHSKRHRPYHLGGGVRAHPQDVCVP